MSGKFDFVISYTFDSIRRNINGYLPLIAAVFITAVAVTASLVSAAACTEMSDEKRKELENVPPAMIELEREYFSAIEKAESVKMVSVIIIPCAAVIGIAVTVFSAALLQTGRSYEIGVYYSLGFGRSVIVITMMLETAIIIFTAAAAGVAAGILAVKILIFTGILFDFSDYIRLTSDLFSSLSATVAAAVFIPTAMLYIRVSSYSPRKLIGRE